MVSANCGLDKNLESPRRQASTYLWGDYLDYVNWSGKTLPLWESPVRVGPCTVLGGPRRRSRVHCSLCLGCECDLPSFLKHVPMWLMMHCILELWAEMNPFSLKGSFLSFVRVFDHNNNNKKKGRQIPLLGSFHKDPCATGCYSNKSCSREQAVSKVILASNRWRSGTSHWLKQAKSPGGYLGVSEAASWVIFKLCLFSLKLTWIYDVNVCVEGKYWKRK